jgi:hypothetical protein
VIYIAPDAEDVEGLMLNAILQIASNR